MENQELGQAALVYSLELRDGFSGDTLILLADGSFTLNHSPYSEDGEGKAYSLNTTLAMEFSPDELKSAVPADPESYPIVLLGKPNEEGVRFSVEFTDQRTWRLGRQINNDVVQYPPNFERWFHNNAAGVRLIVAMVFAAQYPEGAMQSQNPRLEKLAQHSAEETGHTTALPHTAANLTFFPTKYDGLEGVISVDTFQQGEVAYARSHSYKIQGQRLALQLATSTRMEDDQGKISWVPMRPRELVMQDVQHVLGMISTISPAFGAVRQLVLSGASVFAFSREDQLAITQAHSNLQEFPRGDAPTPVSQKTDLLQMPEPDLEIFRHSQEQSA